MILGLMGWFRVNEPGVDAARGFGVLWEISGAVQDYDISNGGGVQHG